MLRRLNDSKNNIQYYAIEGKIDGQSFSDGNIVKGSLSISNQISNDSEFTLGGVFIGQLSVTLIQLGINIPRNSWTGREISLSVFINGDEEAIPLGIFTIATAKHSKGLVQITAYDDMQKFDMANTIGVETVGSAYDFLTMICSECGVGLGMTQAEVENLPNGKIPLALFSMGDIETFRDVLYWLAVTTCSFATIDRYGQLVLRTFHMTPDDNVEANSRFSVSEYGDEQMIYQAATVTVEDTEEIETYGMESIYGYTLNIGANPFMQGPKAQRQDLMENIVTALQNVAYNPCTVTIPFGSHYDLGDVLTFPGGQGSDSNMFCIFGYTFNYYNGYVIKSIPNNKTGKSKTDKSVQNLINTSSQKEFNSYEAKNLQRLAFGDTRTQILQCRIASSKKTKAEIHIEILLESTSNSENGTTTANVYYLIDSEEQERKPVETYLDGKHVLHLMFILELQANTQKLFAIAMDSENGEITIEQGHAWLYASGAALAGEGKNDGNITVSEKVVDFIFFEMNYENVNENVDVNADGGCDITAEEVAPPFEFIEMIFGEVDDSVYITSHSNRRRMTENGLVRKTEDGRIRYTEGE